MIDMNGYDMFSSCNRSSGGMTIAEARAMGFPSRADYKDFYKRADAFVSAIPTHPKFACNWCKADYPQLTHNCCSCCGGPQVL